MVYESLKMHQIRRFYSSRDNITNEQIETEFSWRCFLSVWEKFADDDVECAAAEIHECWVDHIFIFHRKDLILNRWNSFVLAFMMLTIDQQIEHKLFHFMTHFLSQITLFIKLKHTRRSHSCLNCKFEIFKMLKLRNAKWKICDWSSCTAVEVNNVSNYMKKFVFLEQQQSNINMEWMCWMLKGLKN